MAVISTNNPTGLKLRFDCGKNDNGKVIVKTKTYSKVNPNVTNEDLYLVAKSISSLQEHSLIEVQKIDNTTISE